MTYRDNGRIAFKASGSLLPCTRLQNGSDQVVEYDALADPPELVNPAPLNTLHHAMLAGNLYYQAYGPFDTVCTINMESVADSLILKNTVNGQVLFYQLKLGGAGVRGGVMTVDTTAHSDWYERGVTTQPGSATQFGYDDSIMAYGAQMSNATSSMNYDLDVLPTLLALIEAGPPNAQVPMDNNPADWVIKEEYVGTAVWGHVASLVGWGSLSLKED